MSILSPIFCNFYDMQVVSASNMKGYFGRGVGKRLTREV